ncbi:hypothetical protein DES53_107318 [Roseimicrobium gellanilyticum]|uniref:Uncharacterized protein n=1 Tax=Roseimicrobium gellanilyticum TaxID=748857 RepID=A0A366HI23_9BACT|nr:hypothetical protein [Roseimicrobium gellanilyticum]RBP41485.1 hypothetical protein DES53_107318 [Roseimicrobium gellanilyticum]
MSAEGEGNLDNDTAGDMLVDISERLCARVWSLMHHPRGHEYDDQEIGELFVTIEVLFALNDAKLIPVRMDPQKLRKATDEFLERWETYHRVAGKHDPPEERKESMMATFERLNTLAEDFERRRAL